MKPSQRALLVEDDRSWQQILSELLSDAGLEVDLAVSYHEAVTLVSQHSHRLAVVDLSLVSADHQNRDGFKVLEYVRQHDPACVTVLLSGYATVEIAVSALTELGVFTCLRKEMFQRSEFQELIRRLLAVPVLEDTPPRTRLSVEPVSAGLPGDVDREDHPSAIVVEDDAGWRSILGELLSDAGFRVRTCQGFGEALGCLRRETYQLAVVDLSLEGADLPHPLLQTADQPGWEGYRLLASIRSAGIPAVVVSGVANPGEIEQIYQEQGIFSFIEKQSFDRDVFLKTVEEARRAARRAAVQAGHALPLQDLTARELEVLEMISHGATNKEIAEALFITPNTVKRHLKSIFQKLEIHTRSAAAAMAAGWSSSAGGEPKN